MSGYLEHYGAGEERRGKLIKRSLLGLLLLILVGGPLAFYFWDFRQERQVMLFLDQLRAREYKSAYALWGCTDSTPCRDYAFDRFLDDWGPQSKYAVLSRYSVNKSRTCAAGVIVTVSLGADEERLMVDRETLVIGFSPWPVCPR